MLLFYIIKHVSKTVNHSIVIRNGKIVWRHGPYCWYFHLNLKYLGWPYRAYIKTGKNGQFCEELLSENDVEAVLSTFCCYDHGAKASGAVQKIATNQQRHFLRWQHLFFNFKLQIIRLAQGHWCCTPTH